MRGEFRKEKEFAVSDAVFFVVERRAGIEHPSIVYDQLPAKFTGQHAKRDGLVFVLRLDKLSDAEHWLKMTTAQLFATYKKFEAQGCLPTPNIADPPKKAEPAQIVVGHRERFGIDGGKGIPDPFPEPGTIRNRPGAGAFIGLGQTEENGV